ETELLYDGPRFWFNEQDKKRLQELDIDVFLLFCAGLPIDQVLSVARYGFWFFLDQKLSLTGHPPVGFWEVLKQYPLTMQCLQALCAESLKPITLHRYYGPTDLRSIKKSRNDLLWKSASFVTRKLDELCRSRSLEAIASSQQCWEDGFLHRASSNLTVLKTIVSHGSRFVRDRITDR